MLALPLGGFASGSLCVFVSGSLRLEVCCFFRGRQSDKPFHSIVEHKTVEYI